MLRKLLTVIETGVPLLTTATLGRFKSSSVALSERLSIRFAKGLKKPSRTADQICGARLSTVVVLFPNRPLILYPKPALAKAFLDQPELHKKVWQALDRMNDETLMGEGRVYGGGLHKLEPKELGNALAEKILKIYPNLLHQVRLHRTCTVTPNLLCH